MKTQFYQHTAVPGKTNKHLLKLSYWLSMPWSMYSWGGGRANPFSNSGKGFSSSSCRGNTISRAAKVCLGLPGSKSESQGGPERERKRSKLKSGRVESVGGRQIP